MSKRLTFFGLLLLSFYLGYAACSYHLFPLARFIKNWSGTQEFVAQTGFGRLQSFPGKQEITCPGVTQRTAAILVIGQSNSANHAGQKFSSQHNAQIINYFDGKCYVAESPLLGATGTGGESFTLLANKLIDRGIFDRVILIPAGVTDTAIDRWQAGGDLNAMMLNVIRQVQQTYKITHVVWHQGEKDFKLHTSAERYKTMFNSMVSDIRALAPQAQIFTSIASRCGDNPHWAPNNAVTDAQRSLAAPEQNIFLAADTDGLVSNLDRYDDCHFGFTGQQKFAEALANAIALHSHNAP